MTRISIINNKFKNVLYTKSSIVRRKGGFSVGCALVRQLGTKDNI